MSFRFLDPVCLVCLVTFLAGTPPLPCQEEAKEPQKPVPALAHVKLSGELGDRQAPEMPFGRPPLTYRGFLEVLRKAQNDPAVQGILLEVKEPQIGYAKIQGIREALGRLRGSGKKVYLYAEELFPAGAVFAAEADRSAMPESGMVILPGISAELLYLKGLFAILGIDWLVVQEKEYKTAFESFVRDRMSPEQREVLEALLDQWFQTTVNAIAGGRRIPPDRVRQAIDEAILPARRARDLGLIDAVEYRDEFEAAIRRELGGELVVQENYGRGSKNLDLNNPFTLFAQLMKMFSPPERRRGDPTPKLAVVYAEGIITGGKSQASPFGGPGTVGSETMVKAIDEAAGDDSVKAIVLRVDSPGGSGVASDVIWRALMRAREKKPVIASLSDVAASGGYYIAMAAHAIVAEQETITGSIGVIGARPSLNRLLGFWGIRTERLQRGRNAGVFDLFSDPTDDERRTLEAFIAGFYKDFVAKVAMSRGMHEEDVDKVARGRVWTGAQAKEKGLIDEIGGVQVAMDMARKRAGLPEETALRVIEYPEAPDFFESLSEAFESRAFQGGLGLLGLPGLAAEIPGATGGALGLVPGARPLLARLWRLSALAKEPALTLLPFELIKN